MLLGAQMAFSTKIPLISCAPGNEILYEVQNYFTTIGFTPYTPPIHSEVNDRDLE